MIPTPHIGASSKDQIASTVLMPGDPKRAQFIAETYMEDVECFNEVRGMLGFTGTYKGKRVSVMGSGMGIPSAMIYYYELFNFYDVQTIIRVGTAGGLDPKLGVKDIIVATGAHTPNSVVRGKFDEISFAPTPSPDLLFKAYQYNEEHQIGAHFGTILSSDEFYREWPEGVMERLTQYGTLGVEMESAGLFMTALEAGKDALTICTISDNAEEEASAEERETAYTQMMEMALDIAPE